MTRARLALISLCFILHPSSLIVLPAAEAPPAPTYTQDFEKLPPGKPPEEILQVNGAYTVVKIDGNMALEMAGEPLETCGLLVGPAESNTAQVSARIQATASGKRTPEFGIGAGGPGQYRLWLMPATGELQLFKGDDLQKAQPFPWTSGQWTRFKLQVRKTPAGKYVVEGKAWADGKDEPKAWMLTFEDPDDAPAGKAGLYATPYSGTPIRFDDITVAPAGN